MTDMKTDSQSVSLVAEHAGRRIVFPLTEGNGVLIGSSETCGLHLDCEEVAGFHCHVSLDEGRLWVQDWQSDEGTRVNDEPIEDRVALKEGDRLGIGPYSFRVEGQTASGSGAGASLTTKPDPPRRADADAHDETADLAVSENESTSGCEITGIEDAKLTASEPLTASNDAWDETSSEASDAITAGFEAGWLSHDCFDRDTVELLRAEVEDLQSQLAERDAKLAALEAEAMQSRPMTEPTSSDESGQLIARIDQLLDEAEKSDERSQMLEELLHTAEAANRAEQEERATLEAWVADIERRIAEREAEFEGEIEILRNRLNEVTDQRDRAVLQLQHRSPTDTTSDSSATIKQLQQQNRDLEEQLAKLRSEKAGLEQRLASVEDRKEESMREERALLAKERAKVSRLRFTLSRQLAELEEAPEPSNPEDREVAIRIKTLREHLREIHHQEQVEEETSRESSLTGRITRLWKRVEN